MTDLEDDRKAKEKLVEQIYDNRMHALESLRSYGQSAIQGMFLLNSGAIIALLILAGSIASKADQPSLNLPGFVDKLVWALAFFAVGLLFAVATSAVAYLNYGHYARMLWHPYIALEWMRGNKPDEDPNLNEAVQRTARVGIAMLILSAIVFTLGLILAAKALVILVHPAAITIRHL